VDTEDSPDNNPKSNSSDALYIKRLELEQHQENVSNTRDRILSTLSNGTIEAKINLAKELVEGDDKYSHEPVNLNSVKNILTELFDDKNKAITNIKA
jgi:hypothetical protein